MDSLVEFRLPSKRQRLTFILNQLINNFYDFLPKISGDSSGSGENDVREQWKDVRDYLLHPASAASMSAQDTTASSRALTLAQQLLLREGNSQSTINSSANVSEEEDEVINFAALQSVFTKEDQQWDEKLVNDWQKLFSPEMDNQFHLPATVHSHIRLSSAAASTNSLLSPHKSHQSHPHCHQPGQSQQLAQKNKLIIAYFLKEHIHSFSHSSRTINADQRRGGGRNEFDWIVCIQLLLFFSSQWSFRDLHKKLMNLRYQILCSERLVDATALFTQCYLIFHHFMMLFTRYLLRIRCILTTDLWIKEICYDDI
jgi:hypothetical protein